MDYYLIELQQIDHTNMQLVGGKAANIAELTRISGIRVPVGFCISTEAFNALLETTPALATLLEQAARLTIDKRDQIAELSAKLRQIITTLSIPPALQTAIRQMLSKFGVTKAYAIRSSATAEDLPTASFAGQHDSYLNVIGETAIFQQIKQCWASLFTERAMLYRLQNGFDQRTMSLAVIVQLMVEPQVAGVMFTADPITGNRTLVAIEANFGLGEALVAGQVPVDRFIVRNGDLLDVTIEVKSHAIVPVATGGTAEQAIAPDQQQQPALTIAQLGQLEAIGRTIEQHFGQPQDIEWCLADDQWFIVQSRPITTLYPVPVPPDQRKHIYLSVGHQQMMTDAMKPLGLSIWQLTAGRPMIPAGDRLFVDITYDLASAARRTMLVDVLGKSDPLIKDALTTLIERGDSILIPADEVPATQTPPKAAPDYQALIDYEPTLVNDLIKQSETSLATLKQTIARKRGAELAEYILADLQELKQILTDRRSFGVIMTGMNAATWINQQLEDWLGEKNVADILSQSVANNITSAMGLALLDVADVIRPYPAVIEYLAQANHPTFLDDLCHIEGGEATRTAIMNFLELYGMRCSGEIDITRTRWSENPATLIPLILNNIKHFALGASHQKFEQGRQVAFQKEQELLERLRQTPYGNQKAEATKHMIDLLRNFIGYREYPKYHIVSRYFEYKQALLREAAALVQASVLHDQTDIYYLTFEELHRLLQTQTVDYQLINERKAAHSYYQKLSPPRIMTSDGEIITGSYKRAQLSDGVLIGLPVSAGIIEGRARVILALEAANLEPGDILITTFTDPSWTPLFVGISGLVTEVGGLMTHGAVIAREYGIPAVVGVQNATTRIIDGQRIRVHGTEGYIEIL